MEAHTYLTSGWVQQPRVRDLGDGRRVVVRISFGHCVQKGVLGNATSSDFTANMLSGLLSQPTSDVARARLPMCKQSVTRRSFTPHLPKAKPLRQILHMFCKLNENKVFATQAIVIYRTV